MGSTNYISTISGREAVSCSSIFYVQGEPKNCTHQDFGLPYIVYIV